MSAVNATSKLRKLLSLIAGNKGQALVVIIIIAFVCYTVIDKVTVPNQAGHAVSESTIDMYDDIFSRQKLISVSDGSHGPGSDDAAVEAIYQLTSQDVQRLLAAKHILTCKDKSSCMVEDIAPALSSTGDYKTTMTSVNRTIDLYIDTRTNKADWIFRDY